MEMININNVNSLTELLSLLHLSNVPHNKYWYYIEKYQEKQAIMNNIPLNGQFEITPLCNLNCKMCYVHIDHNRFKGYQLLDISKWKDIIRQAHELGMMNAALSGGECLTYPDFDELYLYMRSLGLRVGIKTNGLLLDNKRLDFFNKYPPRNLVISVYGSSNEAYKRVTGIECFDVVRNNLDKLRNVNFPVSITITPNIYMLEDVRPLFEFVESLNLPYMINSGLFPPRENTGREFQDISIDEYVEILKVHREIKHINLIKVNESVLPACGGGTEPHFGLKCSAGRSSFNVKWDGTITGCDNISNMETSVIDKSFSEAWTIINNMAKIFPIPVECSGCVYEKVCMNCVGYHGVGASLGHCDKKVCERTKKLVAEGIYVL